MVGVETALDNHFGELSIFGSGLQGVEGEEYPDLTVCQVPVAAAALVRSWWLRGALGTALIERAAETIRHWQQRNAAARESHIQQTRKNRGKRASI